MPLADDVVEALRRAAIDLIERRTFRDVDATLSQLVATAVALVPGADAGGVSMVDKG